MKKITDLVKALRLKGAPISRRVITSIRRGVVVANDCSILVENGGYLSINSGFGRNVLYRMEKDGNKMVQRKGTTAKIPVAPGILKEVKLDYQRKIRDAVQRYNIPGDLIINFYQTPLSYVCTRGKGKTKQITGTFAVS